MKLKLITNRNQYDPLEKQHLLLLKTKAKGYFITWSLRWSSPGVSRPFFGWGVMS